MTDNEENDGSILPDFSLQAAIGAVNVFAPTQEEIDGLKAILAESSAKIKSLLDKIKVDEKKYEEEMKSFLEKHEAEFKKLISPVVEKQIFLQTLEKEETCLEKFFKETDNRNFHEYSSYYYKPHAAQEPKVSTKQPSSAETLEDQNNRGYHPNPDGQPTKAWVLYGFNFALTKKSVEKKEQIKNDENSYLGLKVLNY